MRQICCMDNTVDKSTLVSVMAWHQANDKPLIDPVVKITVWHDPIN